MKPPVSLKDIDRQHGIVPLADVTTPQQHIAYFAARVRASNRRIVAAIEQLDQRIRDAEAERRRRGLR